MEDNGYGNAMTEIALALAMAFFSIMVLTMISMGVGDGKTDATAGAMLAPPKSETAPAATVSPQAEDLILVYYQGRYLDTSLNPVDPAGVRAAGRVILALEPTLPTREAVAARARIDVRDLVVTVLDDRWLTTLRSKTDARQ